MPTKNGSAHELALKILKKMHAPNAPGPGPAQR